MTRLDDELRACGETLLGGLRSGTRVSALRVRGRRAFFFHVLHEREHIRRTSMGAVPFTRADSTLSQELAVFRLLLNLPARIPVPLTCLTDDDLRVLGRCPAGSVSVREGAVERLASPPLQVDLVLIDTRRLTSSAVAGAGNFASYAKATGLLVTGPEVDVLNRLRAEWYGYGILHRPAAGETAVVSTPRVMTDARQTEASWRFQEEVYQSLCTEDRGFTAALPTSRVPGPV